MSVPIEEAAKSKSQFRWAGIVGIGLAILTCVLWLSGILPGIFSSRDPNAKVIDGMSADALINNLAERGFTITRDFHANKAICKRDRYTVDIDGLSGGVASVTATIEADASNAATPFAFDDRKLMGYIASTAFTDAHTAENIHWAELHFDDSAVRTDGQTVLEIKREADRRSLMMRPVKETQPNSPR